MYKIIVAKPAQKDLKKVDTRYRTAIKNRLKELKSNPYLGKPLRDDLKGRYSLREGVYRIIYRIRKKELIVLIVAVSHRRGIYKKL